MAMQLIADRIAIRRRYARAVDISRDLHDPQALEGYVMTPSARDGLRRLLAGLEPGSSQRAFRVTGPYGSGKSSFGLLLARLFSEEPGNGPAQDLLQQAHGEQTVPAYRPAVLVGRRASLAQDLLVLVGDVARAEFGADDELATAAEKTGTESAFTQGDVKPVLDCLAACAEKLRARKGCGLLLLIDEMGRYLEFAATNPAREDPSLFQQLAERAGGAKNEGLAVVGFLHHRFNDYAAALGGWFEGEWARSSERYEEITFHETCEQSLHLVGQALAPRRVHSQRVRTELQTLYREAGQRGLFTLSSDDLLATARQLYPLHPGAFACLISSSRRFGQNERSIFSFLQSSEPAGYQYFAHQTAYGPSNWYRVDDLFDYLASQGSFRFQSRDRERRWQLAQDAVLVCADMPVIAQRVLKAVSLLATLEPVPGLAADAQALAWLLGCEEGDAAGALAELGERGVIHRRAAQGDWSLWSHSSVDLEHWFEEAKVALPEARRLENDLAELPPVRPIVAQRHYHRTGTLRSFAVSIGNEPPDAYCETDGLILVRPVYPDEDQAAVKLEAAQLSERRGPLSLVRLQPVSLSDLALAQDLIRWKWVQTNCRELRIDDLARAEVERRVRYLENELRNRLAPFAQVDTGAAAAHWFHEGKEADIASRAALNRFLSEICDGVFTDAPVLRNELINRDRLSTAVAAARMRLLELMLTKEECDCLELNGAPPERTIYLSMFQASGMHRKEAGQIRFASPPSDDPMGWSPAWACIDDLVSGGNGVSFDDIIAELGAAPIGLRAGPALLLIAAYMLRHRATIALMERGSFQPEITPAHFMRLAKSPKNFALRQMSPTGGDATLRSLAQGLSIWADEPPAAEFKPIVEALYRWWGQLSDYARSTRTIDATAQKVRTVLSKAVEPIELVFDQLPRACGTWSADGIDVERYAVVLDSALTQIDDALPALRSQATAHARSAFGTRSLKHLRQQVRFDYESHLLELGSYELRAFVGRALNDELSDSTWLDSIAGLVVGKRLDSWDDASLDQFGFEIRGMAQKLARHLAMIRENQARAAPLTAIHVTRSDGTDRSLFVRDGADTDKALAERVRKLLADARRPDALLVELLAELMTDEEPENVK